MNQNSRDREVSFEAFIEDIYLYDDLKELASAIDGVIKVLYVSDSHSITERLASLLPKNILETILTLEKNKVLALTPSELEAYFVSLKAYLVKIPRIALTLAFTPSTEFIAVIGDWLSKNLGKKVLIDLVVKEEIIAGLVIEYQGRFKDYSKAGLLTGVKLNIL